MCSIPPVSQGEQVLPHIPPAAIGTDGLVFQLSWTPGTSSQTSPVVSPVLQKPPLAAVSVGGCVRVEEDFPAELLGRPAVIDGECLRCTAEQVPSRLHYNSCQLLYSSYEVPFSFTCGKCTMIFCRTECPAVSVKNPNQGCVPEDAGLPRSSALRQAWGTCPSALARFCV